MSPIRPGEGNPCEPRTHDEGDCKGETHEDFPTPGNRAGVREDGGAPTLVKLSV
jgi:hypothetical protein